MIASQALPEEIDAGDKLAVGDLVKMFEDSESASYEARQLAERDRDYHDNKQLSDEELAALKKRGQPPYIDNRIKTKVDFLVGLEKQQRIDPQALPRTMAHEEDSTAATQALKYVADQQQYDAKRSACWRNLLIEGVAGMSVSVEAGYNGEPGIVIKRIPWDRLFWDPHSAESDFSDAGYIGTVQWMDMTDARRLYPDSAEILSATVAYTPASDTYDDKPKYAVWGDSKRQRVRIVQMWLKRDEQWHFVEFTKGGILKAGPSPYVDDKGESACELVFQSAYTDRDNNRYGLVREMILIQDAINKRNSKALHLLNTSQIVMVDGAVADIEKVRREAARPDGVIVVNPIGGSLNDSFQFNTRSDLATAHFQMLQEAKASIDLKGPNATQMGEGATGSNAASGRAILASQQGGMVALGDLLDSLRQMDIRIFREVWARIRQFWTAPKWIRTTDDERNIKWVAMNVDPMQLQMMAAQDPQMGQSISGVVPNVAELDCDIVIADGPDGVTLQFEQWQQLTELAKAGIPIPPDELIRAAPGLKNKAEILERMGKPNPVAEQAQQIEVAGNQADAELKQAQALKARADAAMVMHQIQAPPETVQAPMQPAGPDPMQQIELKLLEKRAMSELDFEFETRRKRLERDAGQMKAVGLDAETEIPGETPLDIITTAFAQQSQSIEAQGQAIAQGMGQMADAISTMARVMSAPKQVVRDRKGRVAGVETVGAS